jgi:HSP20 family molecular chaperone IbpA
MEVDAERAKASYEDGILSVRLPIARSEEEPRQVPISEGQGSE